MRASADWVHISPTLWPYPSSSVRNLGTRSRRIRSGDRRDPIDPAGLGEGARLLARDTRLRLSREHLGRDEDDDRDLIDPAGAFDTFAHAADELDRWHQTGRTGQRPVGRVRHHRPEPVSPWIRPLARAACHLVVGPDGRPRSLRNNKQY